MQNGRRLGAHASLLIGDQNLMENVIQFPTQLAIVERILRDALKQAGATDHCADWVMKDMKPRLEAFQQNFSIAMDPGGHQPSFASAYDQMRQILHDSSNHAIGTILMLEIELYQARFPGGVPPGAKASPDTAALLRLVTG